LKPSSLRKKATLSKEQIEEQLKRKVNSRTFFQTCLKVIEKIGDDMDTNLWNHIRGKCTQLTSGVDAMKDRAGEYNPQNQPIPDRVFWVALGIEKAAKLILETENMVNNKQKYEEALDKVSKEIKDFEHRLAQLGVR
jgi:hypothetical protein